MFALVSAIGIPLVIGGTYIKNYAKAYCAALSRYRTAKLMPYNVPSDGSVSLTDIGKAEGIEDNAELSAFRTIASEKMFGEGSHVMEPDSQGNVTVIGTAYAPDIGGEYTCPITIPFKDWAGGLPKGKKVWLPDINGDERVGPSSDYRNGRKSDIMAKTRSDVKSLRNQGVLR